MIASPQSGICWKANYWVANWISFALFQIIEFQKERRILLVSLFSREIKSQHKRSYCRLVKVSYNPSLYSSFRYSVSSWVGTQERRKPKQWKDGQLVIVASATWARLHERNVWRYQKCGWYCVTWIHHRHRVWRGIWKYWEHDIMLRLPGNLIHFFFIIHLVDTVGRLLCNATLSFHLFHRSHRHFAVAKGRQRRWIDYVNHFESRSDDAKIEFRKRRSHISGRQTRPLCGQPRASFRWNISDVSRCLSRVGCKFAKKRLKFLEWVKIATQVEWF